MELTEGGAKVPVGNGGNEKEPVGGTNVPEGNGGNENDPVVVRKGMAGTIQKGTGKTQLGVGERQREERS
jgi:hypothetical protein